MFLGKVAEMIDQQLAAKSRDILTISVPAL
jgi:hypothetical protein